MTGIRVSQQIASAMYVTRIEHVSTRSETYSTEVLGVMIDRATDGQTSQIAPIHAIGVEIGQVVQYVPHPVDVDEYKGVTPVAVSSKEIILTRR